MTLQQLQERIDALKAIGVPDDAKLYAYFGNESLAVRADRIAIFTTLFAVFLGAAIYAVAR